MVSSPIFVPWMNTLNREDDSAGEIVTALTNSSTDRFVSDGLDLRHLLGKHNQLDHAGKHGGKAKHKSLFAKKVSYAARDREALEAAPIKLSLEGTFERGVEDREIHVKLDPQALAMYRGDYYTRINNGLRTNTIDQDEEAAWAAHEIAVTMEYSPLKKPIVAHRGVKNLAMLGNDIDPQRSLVGLEYLDPAPQSSTVDKNVAVEYLTHAKGSDVVSTENRALLNLFIPAGVRAIQLSEYAPPPPPGQERPVTEEAELLLQPHKPLPGTQLPRLKSIIVGDRVVDGLRELDVEVVVIDDDAE